MVNVLSPEGQSVARCFQALSDETRMRIVEILSRGDQCVCDLQHALGAAQPLMSFHLRVLREAGIVSDRRDGRWVHYELRPEALEEMVKYLEERKPDATARAVPCCGSSAAES